MKTNVKMCAASLLIASLLTMPTPFAKNSCAAPASTASAAADSVCLTVEEADSILTTLQLLQIDLAECRAQAALDSAFAAARLRAEHQPWYERIIRHPLVWFAIGAYTASQVTR